MAGSTEDDPLMVVAVVVSAVVADAVVVADVVVADVVVVVDNDPCRSDVVADDLMAAIECVSRI